MPIRSERRHLYPGGSPHSPEWKTIVAAIRQRSGDRCEGTPQHPECRAVNGEPHPETGSRVVLTTAHIDHDERVDDLTRLRHLCQRCHLKWDAAHHRANARATRRAKSGQLEMEGL